jgi:membrane associated rhomboid family serine protease
MVGASGAIAGVLGAYLLIYPWANVHCFVWIVIFFWIITVPAWILLGLWFVMQLLSGLGSGVRDAGVAFWAHVGGFASGIVLMLFLRPRSVILWHAPKTPVFASAPPSAMSGGRRTFYPGSVPSSGRRYPRPPSPWN